MWPGYCRGLVDGTLQASADGEPLLESPKEEARVLRHVEGHPNIVPLLGHYECESIVWTVLELCEGGELYARIAGGGKLKETQCARYMRQIASAISHCHARGIVHLDLSLENVLLDADDNVRVSDFGMARRLKPKRTSTPTSTPPAVTENELAPELQAELKELSSTAPPTSLISPAPPPSRTGDSSGVLSTPIETELLHGRPGKLIYMAPEIYAGLPFDGQRADMFSLGVSLFLMLTGVPPWQTPSDTGKPHTRKRLLSFSFSLSPFGICFRLVICGSWRI